MKEFHEVSNGVMAMLAKYILLSSPPCLCKPQWKEYVFHSFKAKCTEAISNVGYSDFEETLAYYLFDSRLMVSRINYLNRLCKARLLKGVKTYLRIPGGNDIPVQKFKDDCTTWIDSLQDKNLRSALEVWRLQMNGCHDVRQIEDLCWAEYNEKMLPFEHLRQHLQSKNL